MQTPRKNEIYVLIWVTSFQRNFFFLCSLRHNIIWRKFQVFSALGYVFQQFLFILMKKDLRSPWCFSSTDSTPRLLDVQDISGGRFISFAPPILMCYPKLKRKSVKVGLCLSNKMWEICIHFGEFYLILDSRAYHLKLL